MIDYLRELELRVTVTSVLDNGNAFISCVFHDERTPSLAVSTSTGRWRCWGCGQAGSFEKLIAEIDGISIDEVKKKLGITEDVELARIVKEIKEDLDPTEMRVKRLNLVSFYERFPIAAAAHKVARAYLVTRNIRSTAAKLFDLRWGGNVGRWRNRIILPVYTKDDKVVAFAGRTVNPNIKPKIKKYNTTRTTLFGVQVLMKHFLASYLSIKADYVILVEGPFDAIYLTQLGYNAVAAMGTSALTSEQIKLLLSITKKVIIAYDGDSAGMKAADREYNRLRQFIQTCVVRLPENKDPDQLTQDELTQVFKGAI